MRFFWVYIDHLAADRHDLCFDFILSGLEHIILQSDQIHSYIFQWQMTVLLRWASLWFGCWHNLEPVANVGEERHHIKQTFQKWLIQEAWDARYLSFFYLAGTLPASASIASSCGASILMKRHVAPKTKSHHTLAMCGKEHPTRDPACATSTRVTFPWDFRRWISSHQ